MGLNLELSRRAFLISAASSITATSLSAEELTAPRNLKTSPDLNSLRTIAEECGLKFKEQVMPEKCTGIIVHFPIVHANSTASGLAHVACSDLVCDTPTVFVSERLQVTLGVKVSEKFGKRMAALVCEGAASGRVIEEPKENFALKCADGVQRFLEWYNAESREEQKKMLMGLARNGEQYERWALSKAPMRIEERAAFSDMVAHCRDLRVALESKNLQQFPLIEDRIQRSLERGRMTLLERDLPVYGAELTGEAGWEEAQFMLTLYNGGEALAGPLPAVSKQILRNGRYVTELGTLLKKGVADQPAIAVLYLGAAEIHDLEFVVKKYNEKTKSALGLCRLEFPPFSGGR